MEKKYNLLGSQTPGYLDYLATNGPISLKDFADAMNVTVSGLKTNLGSIERDANGKYGADEQSLGPNDWGTVFKLTGDKGAESLEIVRSYYDEYCRRRDAS